MLSKHKVLQTKWLSTAASAIQHAAPYDKIPGPPGQGLPLLGHTLLTSKKPHGFGKAWLNMKEIQQKYLKPDDKLIRFNSRVFNPKTGNCVFLLDPQDVEHVYRHEGKYPNR